MFNVVHTTVPPFMEKYLYSRLPASTTGCS